MEVVLQEARCVTKGVAVCSFLFLAASLLFDFFSLPLLWGAVLGGAYAVANFLLIGYSVQESLTKTPEKAKGYMSRQYYLRLALTALVLFLAIQVDFINPWGVIPALFYPKISIYARSVYQYATRDR